MKGEEEIIRYLKKFVAVTEEEAELFASCFTEKRVKKGQYLVQPGFTDRQRNYVVKGALRAFVVDEKGIEHTISLAIEDWWISDVNSFIYQQPATMFIVAVENSVILQLSYAKEEDLKKKSHHFETFFRIRAERSMAFLQRRIISNLTQSAEERYDSFMETYPLLAARVPQYALASYLDMTTQFFTRIRKKKMKK